MIDRISVAPVLVTTNGDTIEAWADLCTRHIVEVADTAPGPIREQAITFRGQIREVVLAYMRQAAQEEARKLIAASTAGGR